MFPCTNYGNTLLVNDTHHKSMFNPPFNAIFLQTFYSSATDGNYLLEIVSCTWNPCIHLECRFLNFWSVIHSRALHMFFLLSFGMINCPYNAHPNVVTLFVTR